jgi:hypothetical protein
LRNTFDQSICLSELRGNLIKEYSKRNSREVNPESVEALNMVVPKQNPGHYIHGPKLVLHKVNTYDIEQVNDLLDMELKKLCHRDGDALCNTEVATIYRYLKNDELILFSETVKRYGITVKMVECWDSFSAEWPTVIVLHKSGNNTEDQTSLYLEVSRARVYSVIIAFPESGKTFDDEK